MDSILRSSMLSSLNVAATLGPVNDLTSKLFVLAVTLLVMQIIIAINKRRYRHKTFDRMKIGGPKPHFITGNLYQTREETYVKFASKMHEIYGRNVGFFLGGDPYLLTKDLDLIQQVFVAKSRIFYDRFNFYLNVDPVPDNLICQRGDRWRYMRKLLTPAFSNSKIRSSQFYRDTQRTAEKLMAQLAANSSLVECAKTKKKQLVTEVEDSYDRMAAVALDVVVKTAFHMDDAISFDEPLNEHQARLRESQANKSPKEPNQSNQPDKKNEEAFLTTVKSACKLSFNPLVTLIFCFPFLDGPLTFLCNKLYYASVIQHLINHVDQLVRRDKRQRKRTYSNARSKLDMSNSSAEAKTLMSSSLNGKLQQQQQPQRKRIIDSLIEVLRERKITKSEFTGNAFVIVFAGFETTANAMTFTLWLLSHHMRVQEKLRQELRTQMAKVARKRTRTNSRSKARTNSISKSRSSSFIDDDDLQASQLADNELAELAFGCDYLENVINESMRLYPPVPGLSCRQASEDCTLSNGMRIEKGVNVIPSVFEIHRDVDIWGDDANDFKPERFEMLDVSQLNSARFMPFGLGPRNCIGKSVAIHEMKIIIGRLILEYSIEQWEGRTPQKMNLCSPINITITNADKIGMRFVKISPET